MKSYAALWCKSNFSFLEGASQPDELVEAAHRHGLTALALTDRDGVYGVVRAHVKARELGVKLIVGAQVTLDDGARVVVLARDRGGYANLCQLLSTGRLRSPKGSCSVTWREVCERARGTLALLGAEALASLGRAGELAGDLHDAFGDASYALLARHRRADEVEREGELRARARELDLPVVACNEVLYHHAERRRLQDVLTCIRHGTALSEAGWLLRSNAEHDLKTPHAFQSLFADDPAACERTLEIQARCTFTLAELRYRYPSECLPDGTTSAQRLRELCARGARARYGADPPPPVTAQIDKELALIEELDYCGYFLTMRDIVEFCRAHDILCQGRGSAANSVVCYCLCITAVDPVRMGLLFERFLSRERAEPPDIDLDIEHERREEVIQHVYAKYGRSHAAMVANVVRYRPRSALRDVGKALGIAPDTLARLAQVANPYAGLDPRTFADAQIDASTRDCRNWLELAGAIEGFPRHLSIHPGGFLLGHEPVAGLVPIENGAMAGRTVIQWDKDDIETLGLFKVDLLGLGALTHLHRCFDLLALHEGLELSLASVPDGDEATYDMIDRADTVGVFQIESRAQMAMLPRLRPRNYYDLVIEVSIVRPGPITGGMVHPYLRRRRGLEPVEYPHERLRPVLEKTLGVPLFQEQVMRLAMVAADYTPGEADQLRRDMAAWRKGGRIEAHRERLIGRMQQKGIDPEFAERVYNQIRGFGEYGFPESHAASFALISYVGAWLKCHHPAVFTCALLNAQPMGFYSISTLVEDAKRHGLALYSIDLCRSDWDCTLERHGAVLGIRMGARLVKGLERAAWRAVRDAYDLHRPETIQQLWSSAELDAGALRALAAAGALEFLADERRSAWWISRGLTRRAASLLGEPAHEQPSFAPMSTADLVSWDQRCTRHSTRAHPLAPLREQLTRLGLPDARTVARLPHGKRVRFAGLVICRQRPQTASGVLFMTLEDETGFVNAIVRREVYERFAALATTQLLLGLSGRIQSHEGVTHLLAVRLWNERLPALDLEAASRDFC